MGIGSQEEENRTLRTTKPEGCMPKFQEGRSKEEDEEEE